MCRHRELAFIGLMNSDPRSFNINAEAGAFVRSPGLAEDLARVMDVIFQMFPKEQYSPRMNREPNLYRRAGAHPVRLALTLSVLLAACGAPAWKEPVPLSQVDFRERYRTATDGAVSVTVAVPSRQETEQLFGTDLYAERIQPVWVEVDNRSDKSYLLVKVGMDPNAFSPLETAYQRHSGSQEVKRDMDWFFYRAAFRNPADAGALTSGYVFTNLDEGQKAVNVDLVANDDMKAFSFVVPVPGLVTDTSQVNFEVLYEQWIDLETEDELRTVLEGFPCCTTNRDGSKNGDPLNVVFVGRANDVFSALIRRGWHQTEVTYGASAWKTVKSFLFGARYRYSPISPLYVFGRQQDAGLQKARDSIHLRNHMRIWLTQYRFQGKPVFLGQISRDIGVKFNKRTVTTHAIDPDLDDTRSSLAGDLAYSQAATQIGFVKGSQRSTLAETYYNLTPDPYYSDGNRVVIFFDERPTRLSDIRTLDWEVNSRINAMTK